MRSSPRPAGHPSPNRNPAPLARVALLALAIVAVTSGRAVAADPAPEDGDAAATPPGPARIALDGAIADVAGHPRDPAPAADRPEELRVFVFLDTQCPVANRYIPTLNRLVDTIREASGAPVSLFGILSHPTFTREAAAAHSKEYRITFPVLFDERGTLARAFQPTHTPEAFLLDSENRVRYRGRIDNLYEQLGRTRGKATVHHLVDAAVATARGEPVAVPWVEPVGCLYENPWDEDRASTD